MAVSPRAAFFGNVAIATFHPKTIIFYVAFVPQFIDARGSYAAQASILTLTFCAVVIVTDTTYALTAATMPYVLALADKGVEQALADDPHLAAGVNIQGGKIIHPAVKAALG